MNASEIKIIISGDNKAGSAFSKAQSDTDTLKSKVFDLKNAMASLGVTIGGLALGQFLVDTVKTAENYQNALRGLASIARYAGEDIGKSMAAAEKITVDGMMSMEDAATSLKNLLSRGFSLDESIQLINAFKDSAAFGRQASLSFGEAVRSATEGIKNENSILVDNAGITKNVSVMWKEYAAAHGTSVDKMSLAEKRQAELNGILVEAEGVMGNAEVAAAGLTGKMAKLAKATLDFKVAAGDTFAPTATVIIDALTKIINKGFTPYIQSVKQATIYTAGFLEKANRRGGQSLFDMIFNPVDTSDIDERVRSMIDENPLFGPKKNTIPEIGKDSGKRQKTNEIDSALSSFFRDVTIEEATKDLEKYEKQVIRIDNALESAFSQVDDWSKSLRLAGIDNALTDFFQDIDGYDGRIKVLAEERRLLDELSLAAMPRHKQQVEEITRRYDEWQRQVEDLAGANRLTMEEAQAWSEGLSANMQAELDDIAASEVNLTTTLQTVWEQAQRNMTDYSQDFFFDIMKGNLDDLGENFENMVLRMVANWQAAQLQMALWGSDSTSGGGIGNGLIAAGVNAIFGPSTTKVARIDADLTEFFNFHAGGQVGRDGKPGLAPSFLWDNAPRLHGGLMPDEFPAILQRGETVIPKGGQTAGQVTVNLYNQGNQRQDVANTKMKFDATGLVVDVFLRDMAENGPMRRAIAGGM